MSDSITYRKTPIHFKRSGKGPFVVLLHGFTESLEIWNEFTQMLEDEFSVLSVDLPGHGRSGLMDEVHTMEAMADAVVAVADYAGAENFIICGHSMGGYVALNLASRFPAKVKGIALFHSHGAPDDEQTKINRLRTIEIVKNDHKGFIHQFIPDLFAEENRERLENEILALKNRAASTSSRSIIASLEGMRQRSGSLDFLMETKMPLFFIIGRQDSRMPYNKVIAQAMMVHHAEIMLIDGIGHMGFLEAPGKILPALRDFFIRNGQ